MKSPSDFEARRLELPTKVSRATYPLLHLGWNITETNFTDHLLPCFLLHNLLSLGGPKSLSGEDTKTSLSEAKDHSIWTSPSPPAAWPHLIKTFYSYPIKASSSLRSPALISQVHTITLINLLCLLIPSFMLVNPFPFCDKNLDWDEASVTSLVPPCISFQLAVHIVLQTYWRQRFESTKGLIAMPVFWCQQRGMKRGKRKKSTPMFKRWLWEEMSAKQTERNQGYQQNDVLKGKMGKKLRCLYFYVDDSGKNS